MHGFVQTRAWHLQKSWCFCCLHFWSRCFCWHLLFALLLLLLVVVVLVFLLVFVVCTSVGGGAGGEMVVLVERWEHLKTTISDLSPKGFVECWCQKENIYQIFFNLSKKYLYAFLGSFLGCFWSLSVWEMISTSAIAILWGNRSLALNSDFKRMRRSKAAHLLSQPPNAASNKLERIIVHWEIEGGFGPCSTYFQMQL